LGRTDEEPDGKTGTAEAHPTSACAPLEEPHLLPHSLQAVILGALQRTVVGGEPIPLVADASTLANACEACFPFFQQCVNVWLPALLAEHAGDRPEQASRRRLAAAAGLRALLLMRGRAAHALTPLLRGALAQPLLSEEVRMRLRALLAAAAVQPHLTAA
jgi:hypothetical protein